MSRQVDRRNERRPRSKTLARLLFWSAVLGVIFLVSNGWLASIIYPSGGYFGRFAEHFRTEWVERAGGRPGTKLLEDFWFEDPDGAKWTVPAGHVGDGASIPQYLWTFAGPYEGNYIYAAVIHDYYCETRERTAHDTHRDFYNGMRAKDVPKWQADFMYWAVEAFGPQWRLTTAGKSRQSAAVDLSDPVVLAAAKAKSAAIARTLRSSQGEVLDSAEGGLVENTPAELERNAEFYRASFTSRDFLDTPQSLGLLSFWTDDIGNAGWRNQRIPAAEDAASLEAVLQDANPDASLGYVLLDGASSSAVANAFLAAEAFAEGRRPPREEPAQTPEPAPVAEAPVAPAEEVAPAPEAPAEPPAAPAEEPAMESVVQ